MEHLVFRPVEKYRTALFSVWFIVVVLVAIPLAMLSIFIPDSEGRIVFGIMLAVFIAVMLPVAIWIPYYQKSLVFEITHRHVIMEGGVFWKKRATVPYSKVTNVDTTQGPLERYFGFGTVHVQTAGAGGAEGGKAEVRLAGITDFDKLKDIVLNMIEMSSDNITVPVPGISGIDQNPALERIHSELVAIRKTLEHGKA